MDIRTTIAFLPGFLVGITVHEAAHALASKWLGDCYAQNQGRISLNPLRHLSATGTLLLLLVGFGWGKPVPVNLYNYKHPRFYYLIVSLAGPVSNFLVVIILFVLPIIFASLRPVKGSIAADMVLYGIIINLMLALINLIPIPPLDGSKIWPCLIPGLRPVHSDKTMKFWLVVLVLIFVFQVPSKIANYGGRQLTAYVMKQKGTLVPENFPQEMQVPKAAYRVHYSQTLSTNGEPNEFSASFWLHQPYPATEYRSWLVERMAELGWSESANNDPNKWEMSDIINDKNVQYRILTWMGSWEKKNKTFYTSIAYYTDPNGQYKDEISGIENKYAIINPLSIK